MSKQSVWVRCKVDDEDGISHVLIKGHDICVTPDIATVLEADGKVERIPEPRQAVNPPEPPKLERRIQK